MKAHANWNLKIATSDLNSWLDRKKNEHSPPTNKEKRKIVLNHEEIKSINMSPMTMPFSVERVSLLQDLVKGDHVFFYVENVGGELIIKRMVKDNK